MGKIRYSGEGMIRRLLLICTFFNLIIISGPDIVSGETVKIGVITDLSGALSQFGKETQIGAEILKKELAAEGKSLDIIYGDSQLKPMQGVSEIQKILSMDSPDAFYVDFTPVAVAAAPVLAAARKLAVHISVSTEANRINEFYFKGYLDYEQGCRCVALYWKGLGITKIAGLKFNGEIGERCIDGAISVYPGFKTYAFNWGDPMAALVEQIRKDGAQAVIFGGYEQDFVNFLEAAARVHLKVLYGGAEGDMLTELEKQKFPVALEGAAGFNFKFMSEEFKQRIREIDPANTFQLYEAALCSYVHLRQLFNAISACPRNDVQCQKEVISRSPESPMIGFTGWDNRVAKYGTALRVFRNGLITSL